MSSGPRRRFIVEPGSIAIDPEFVSRREKGGRRPAEDDALISEALAGLKAGDFSNDHHAAATIARRIGGPYQDANRQRLYGKLRRLRSKNDRTLI